MLVLLISINIRLGGWGQAERRRGQIPPEKQKEWDGEYTTQDSYTGRDRNTMPFTFFNQLIFICAI